MSERIESISREGTDFLADYVADVADASAKFMATLLGNVETLVRGVIREGLEVAYTATSAFLPEEGDEVS